MRMRTITHAHTRTARHTHTHRHTHTCIRTVEHHDAYGLAAKEKGKNMRKLHVGSITMRHSNGDVSLVENTVFAPKSGDAEKYGWQVSALPRVIPTPT